MTDKMREALASAICRSRLSLAGKAVDTDFSPEESPADWGIAEKKEV